MDQLIFALLGKPSAETEVSKNQKEMKIVYSDQKRSC
jgi:hypothetical protein